MNISIGYNTNNLYVTKTFKGKIMYNHEQERNIVKTLYEYAENKISNSLFDKTIQELFNNTKQEKNIPTWLNSLVTKFKFISDNPEDQEFLGCISRDSFKYDVLKTLQQLQNNGEYSEIIKKDYSSII